MLYRYELSKNGEGIIVAMDDYFSMDEFFKLGWLFEVKLKGPTCDMEHTKSYFTEKGHRRFRKNIRKIIKVYEGKGVEVKRIEIKKSKLKNIIYTDKYQVVVKYEENKNEKEEK